MGGGEGQFNILIFAYYFADLPRDYCGKETQERVNKKIPTMPPKRTAETLLMHTASQFRYGNQNPI